MNSNELTRNWRYLRVLDQIFIVVRGTVQFFLGDQIILTPIWIYLSRVFWLNIAKFEVNWCYRYCFNLFSNLRKESELRQYHCRNSTKVGKRKIKSRRDKFLIFGNGIAAIPFAHTCCLGGCSKCECAQGKPNDVEIFFFFGNCGNVIVENGRKKNSDCRNHMWGIKKKVLRLQYFYKKSHVISYY